MAKDGASGWAIAATVLLGAAGIGYVASKIHESNEQKRTDELADRLITEYEREMAAKAAREQEEQSKRFEAQKQFAYCPIHRESEQCLADSIWHPQDNRCIECNGGLANSYSRYCQNCEDSITYNTDDDD
jgi:hypothetical protein